MNPLEAEELRCAARWLQILLSEIREAGETCGPLDVLWVPYSGHPLVKGLRKGHWMAVLYAPEEIVEAVEIAIQGLSLSTVEEW